MDDWRDADEPACPACGESLEPTVMECSACGETLLSDDVAEMLDERASAAFESEIHTAPKWATVLTALSLGIATAPLVVYAAVIATGSLPLVALVGLLLAGWLVPAAALSRLPNPSAVLARGLYFVIAGISGVVLALGYDAVTGGSSVVTDQTGLVVAALSIPAIVALVLARRISSRAARQVRGEPGPLHRRAGIGPDDDGPPDDES